MHFNSLPMPVQPLIAARSSEPGEELTRNYKLLTQPSLGQDAQGQKLYVAIDLHHDLAESNFDVFTHNLVKAGTAPFQVADVIIYRKITPGPAYLVQDIGEDGGEYTIIECN